MIKSMKGKLLLAIGIALILEVVLFLVLLSIPTYCGACAITDKPCPPCPRGGDWQLTIYLAAPLFVIIFLILHIISRYKK